MKKIKFLLIAALFIGGFSFTGCKDDEKPAGLSREEAEAELDLVADEMSVDVQELTDADAIKALNRMFSLIASDPDLFGARAMEEKPEKQKMIAREKIDYLAKMFTPKEALRISEGNFDFEAHLGIYNWNTFEERFVKEGVSNIIVLNFPTEGSSTNNATFRLINYVEQEFNDEGFIFYSPSEISADLSVDEVNLVQLSMEVTYNELAEPTAAAVSFFVKPFNFILEFDNAQSTSSIADAALLLNDEIILASGITANYTDATKMALRSANGFIQYRNIKIEGSVNAQAQNVNDINDIIQLHLLANGKKVGDIIFIYEEVTDEWGTYEETVPYVRFNDGTTKKLELVLEPVINNIESFFDDLSTWNVG